MVKPPYFFDLRGYEFQIAVDALRKSAETGSDALRGEIRVLEQQLEDYRRVGEFEGERDEEGNVLWDQDNVLRLNISLAYEALMELRKAFAIAAYHIWERSVQRWHEHERENVASGGTDSRKKGLHGHKGLSTAAREIGYPDNPELVRVMTLANAIKHNSTNSGKKLLELWSDIFPPGFDTPPRMSDWASSIQLTDRHLMEIFGIVSKSGPVSMP
jgi:hypothetical protein